MSVNKREMVRSFRARSNHRSRRRMVVAAILGSILLPLGGCSAFTGMHNSWTYNAGYNERMLVHKNSWAAKKAWHARSHCFANQKYIKDFARGFRAGYLDVADGGTGCVPTFPPREYWGWKYQSCEGQARVSAWFSGFPHGARAAEEDGMGNYSQIQTSLGIQQQYAQHGMLDPAFQGMYPIPQAAVPDGYNNRSVPVSSPMGEVMIEHSESIIAPELPLGN